MRKIILFSIAIFCSLFVHAQFITGGDNSDNYSTWSNGNNEGFGFGSWVLWADNSGGWFLGSSVGDGFGNIDGDNGESFGLYGNPAGNNYAYAKRAVNNWSDGATLSFDLAIAYRNGNKGFDLYSTGDTWTFNFKAGNDNYYFNSGNTGWTYSQTSVFHVVVTQDGTDLYVEVSRGTDNQSTTFSNTTLESVKFYCGSTTDGNALNNLYFNNLSIEYQSPDNVPATADVLISGFAEVGATETLTCNDLEVAGGNTLTLKSTSGGTGSLLTTGTVTGDVSIERYIPGYSKGSGWYLLSSPVSNQAISDFDGVGGDDDFFKWDESGRHWINRTNSDGNLNNSFETTFSVGTGYLVGYSSQVTKTFTGTINTGIYAFNGMSNSGAENDGWHLLGNPYTCGVSWNNTGGSWNLSHVVATAKSYNQVSGNWDDISQNDYIPAMQGFFVQVGSGFTGSLTIPADARGHGGTWAKETINENQVLKLEVYGGTNTYYDIVRVNFNDMATNEFDIEYDSHKMFGDATAPQLFTKMGEENYSTNSFNYERSEKTVDLAFRAGTDGEYTIEVLTNTLENVDGVYLEDLFENVTVDLNKSNTYNFSATTGDNENRFRLVFGATGIQETQKEALQAYVSGQNLYVNGEEGQATLTIYDMQGKQLYNEQVELTSQFRKSLDLPQGIYVVSIQNNQVVKTAKVIIK